MRVVCLSDDEWGEFISKFVSRDIYVPGGDTSTPLDETPPPWYGAQTCIASTAVALLIGTFIAADGGATFLGMTAVGWVSFVLVWSFQMVLFWNGIDWIRVFLNWAAPSPPSPRWPAAQKTEIVVFSRKAAGPCPLVFTEVGPKVAWRR